MVAVACLCHTSHLLCFFLHGSSSPLPIVTALPASCLAALLLDVHVLRQQLPKDAPR